MLQFKSIQSEKATVNSLSDTLFRLKKNYDVNRDEILENEDKLNAILDFELEDKVRNYIKLEAVNDEKMTPQFLNMAKAFSNDSLYNRGGRWATFCHGS